LAQPATGSAALAFASAGYQVVGLDRSAAMLAEARRKATATTIACAFIRADLRAFAFQRPFDLITCCYDSLNYLLSHADLVTACHQVRAALAPRGLFVADLTTAHAYAHEPLTPNTFDLGDIAYGWQTAWHPTSQQATTTLTVTTRHSNNSSTVTERHQQRAYAPAEVTDALHASGLQLLAALAVSPQQVPTLLPPTAGTARIIYVATPMAEEQ
jgi:SAM-dependent methyltransferase